MKRHCLLSLTLLFPLAALGCADSPSSTPDLGPTPDAGDMVDAGGRVDMGPPPPCDSAMDCPTVTVCEGDRVATYTYTCPAGTCVAAAPSYVDCAAPLCDAGGDHVVESCVEVMGAATCASTTVPCNQGVTTSCAGGSTTVTTRGCDASTGCTSELDTTVCPTNASACQAVPGRLEHVAYTPTCNVAGDGCDPGGTEMITTCSGSSTTCSGGTITVVTPTCDPATGCDTHVTETPCPTAASSCSGLDWTYYVPLCQSGSLCDRSGEQRMRTCTASAPTCVDDTRVSYVPTCDDASGCGETRFTQDCTANTSFCGRGLWTWSRGLGCSEGSCMTRGGSIDCAAGGSACFDTTSGVNCPGSGDCSGGTCGGCTLVSCTRGQCVIDPRTDIAVCRTVVIP